MVPKSFYDNKIEWRPPDPKAPDKKGRTSQGSKLPFHQAKKFMPSPQIFKGGYGPETYLAWTAHIDTCFFHYHTPEHERLPQVLIKLCG